MTAAAHPIRRRFPAPVIEPVAPPRNDVKLFLMSFAGGFVVFSTLIF